ncbi:PAS domain-containing protein [Thalassobellus citreus]|uniref:PAS domain-containing protein n=1 Tax=Thalassobellus citreus TaxID=3367752 RepID=UPI0037B04615
MKASNDPLEKGKIITDILKLSNSDIQKLVSNLEECRVELTLQNKMLKESEEIYRWLYESNPMPMVIYDTDTLEFISVNNAVVEKYGYTEEEFYNMTILDIRPDSEKEKTIQSVKAIDNGLTNAGVFIHQKKNGELIEVEIIRQRFLLEEKNATLVLVNDVTVQKQIEREKNELQEQFISTIDGASEGFVSFDVNWVYNYVNHIAADMIGRKVEDLLGKHIWTEFPETIDKPLYDNFIKAMETQEKIVYNDYFAPWDKWIENRLVPSKKGLFVFFKDITEKRELDLKLKNYNDNLEELVKERTKEIQEKNEMLEKMNKLFVGRELRMKELKEELKKLKEKYKD